MWTVQALPVSVEIAVSQCHNLIKISSTRNNSNKLHRSNTRTMTYHSNNVLKALCYLACVVTLALLACIISFRLDLQTLKAHNDELRQHNNELREMNEELKFNNSDLKLRIKELLEQNERLVTLDSKEDVIRVVMAEARGESLQGQMAVAQTILDRSIEQGKTSEEIIFSPLQYAKPYTGEISEMSEFAVDMVYLHGYRVFEEPTTHFYGYDKVNPYWADSKIERGVIGTHRFMY